MSTFSVNSSQIAGLLYSAMAGRPSSTELSLLWLIVALVLAAPWRASSWRGHRPEVIISRHGAVATDDGRCSRVGRDILREGGHAVDAAVAAALCLGVVSPASSGLGGGAFMLLRLANGKAQAFDSRETAPLSASQVKPTTFCIFQFLGVYLPFIAVIMFVVMWMMFSLLFLSIF